MSSSARSMLTVSCAAASCSAGSCPFPSRLASEKVPESCCSLAQAAARLATAVGLASAPRAQAAD
eukprot:11156139-Lingulodinium_polyedra.AAC.1